MNPFTLIISNLLCNPLLKSFAAPHFNKVSYLADRDDSKVTWFQEMMTHVPKVFNTASALQSQRTCEAILSAFHTVTPGNVHWP